MKKIALAVIMTVILLVQNGCFGSFTLTNKVYKFNDGIDNDVAQEVVFLALAIVQVYTLAAIFDALLFNTIEYWAGSNPIAMKEGEIEERIVENSTGTYKVITTRNKVQVQDMADATVSLTMIYNPDKQSWSMKSK